MKGLVKFLGEVSYWAMKRAGIVAEEVTPEARAATRAAVRRTATTAENDIGRVTAAEKRVVPAAAVKRTTAPPEPTHRTPAQANLENPVIRRARPDAPAKPPHAMNDDHIDETKLRRTADQPRPLADAVAKQREIGSGTKPVSPSDPNAPKMSANGGDTPGGPGSGTQGAGTGAGGAPPGGGASPPGGGSSPPPPPPPGGGNPQAMTPEAIDRLKQWEIQGMVMNRLGSIESDFLELERGTRLSLERINNLENSLNVGGQFSKDATRVQSLEELIERVNIAEQKRVKASGLTNFFAQTPETQIHPDDFKIFIREGSMGALPPIPGVSGPLGSAGSTVKGQNLNADGVRALKEKLTDTGRINDLLDPKSFKDIKTPSQLDRYFRENPGNAVPGTVFDEVVGKVSRGKEVSSIGIGKFKSPELTRTGWRNLVIAGAVSMGAPVALDTVSPDIGVSAGYYTSLPVRGVIEGFQMAGSLVSKGENLSSGADYKLFLANNDSEFRAKLLKLGNDYSQTGNGVDYASFIKAHPEYVGAVPADIEAGLNLQKKLIIEPATQRAEAIKAQSEIINQDSTKLAADRSKAAQQGLNSLVTSSGTGGTEEASPESITESFNIAQFAGNLKEMGFKGNEIDTVISAYNNAAVGDGFNPQDVADAQKLRTGLASIQPERRDVVLQSLGVSPAP